MNTQDNYITVKSLGFSGAANLYQARLQAANIDCFVFNASNVLPIDASPMGGILLKVKEEDLQQAREIVEALDHDFLSA